MTLESMLLFAGAALALIVVPGPAIIYVIARSVQQGRMAGLVSTWGVATGAFAQVVLAAFGLAALLAQSAIAFSTLRYLGAAYLVWLGVQQIRSRNDVAPAVGRIAPRALLRIYSDGVVVCLLNPKSALFFLAFLPQFVDMTSPAASGQMLMLGGIFVVIALVSDGIYALTAAAIGERLTRSTKGLARARVAAGSTFIGLGLVTAFAGGGREGRT